MAYRAVLFDLGGVVCGSPLEAISQYSRDLQTPLSDCFSPRVFHPASLVPSNAEPTDPSTSPTSPSCAAIHPASIKPNVLSRIFLSSQAFRQLERGQIDLDQFYSLFDSECKQFGIRNMNSRELMKRMHVRLEPRPEMIQLIQRLRSHGLLVAAVTNNWKKSRLDARGVDVERLDRYFDLVVESCVVGIRKPDTALLLHACRKFNVQPSQCVFLDDIGRNLAPARSLGFQTIRVGSNYHQAIRQLVDLLQLDIPAEGGARDKHQPAIRSRL